MTGDISRLLPQPGGFEGLVPRLEGAPRHNQAITKRPDPEEVALNELAAIADADLFVNDTDDVLPGVALRRSRRIPSSWPAR